MKGFLKSQAGQTAVEYLLLVAVAVTIGVAFTKAAKAYLLQNPNSMMNKQLKQLNNQFDSANSYKYYKIP
jgi:hypothetical protein